MDKFSEPFFEKSNMVTPTFYVLFLIHLVWPTITLTEIKFLIVEINTIIPP